MEQLEPISVKLPPSQAMALDLTDYVDDAAIHVIFLRVKGVDTRGVQTELRAKLADLRRAAIAYPRSSEAEAGNVIAVTAECRAILAPFAWYPAAQRISTCLDQVLKRLQRTTTKDDCTVSAGIFIAPGR